MAAIISAASFVLASASSPSSSEENASKSVKLRDDWRNRSKPIRPGGVYPAKEHCSRCGLCDTYYIAHVRDACAFLGAGMSRIEMSYQRLVTSHSYVTTFVAICDAFVEIIDDEIHDMLKT